MKRYWIGALSLTLCVRLYLFLNYYTINNDGVLYIGVARHFWEGQWKEGLASFYPPLFSLMIAAVYPLAGDWELAGLLWPLILGVLALLPLFGLFHSLFGLRVAKVALFFYAVSPYLARLSLEVRTEIPYVFFLVLALYLLQRGLEERKLGPFFLAGISSALAYLTRPEGIGIIIVGVSFLLYRRWIWGDLERCRLKTAAFILGFALFSIPYLLYLKHDTGRWLISRKTGMILSIALGKYDPDTEQVDMEQSDQVNVVDLIRARPLTYAKKVFVDWFRSLGFYFEALHYSYLLFLFMGWFLLFYGRFWEKKDFLLIAFLLFYLVAFSLLYITRRYGVPLAAVSLGWVGVGYLAIETYCVEKWGRRGWLIVGLLLVVFLAGTLPKTLQAIGWDKLYLREAGAYLKAKAGNPKILTTNARVAFYAEGPNQVSMKGLRDFPAILSAREGDYLALDGEIFRELKQPLKDSGWVADKEFSRGSKERLLIFRRPGIL